MKVADLIEQLMRCDQDMEILVADAEHHNSLREPQFSLEGEWCNVPGCTCKGKLEWFYIL